MKRKLLTGIIAIIFLAGFIMPLFSATLDTPYIKSVQLKKTADKLEVSLFCTKPVEYKVISMKDPYYCLIIDIFPAQLSSDAKVFDDISCGNVKGVRIGQFSDKPDIVRLVIDLANESKYEINAVKDKPGLILAVDYKEKTLNKPIVLNKTIPIAPVSSTVAVGKTIQVASIIKTTEIKPVEPIKVKDAANPAKETKVIETIKSKPIQETKVVEPIKSKSAQEIKTEETIKVKKIDMPLAQNPLYNNKNKTTEKQIALTQIKSPAPEKTLALTQTAPTTKKASPAPKEPTFNVEYDNEDIVYILNQLAKKTGRNIVTDSSVTGTVTVSLKNVTLDRALQVILKTAGLAYKTIDNIIIVSKPENLAKISPVSIKKGFGADTIAVIPINYASADTLKKAIQDIIPDLDITIDKRLNAFVISASESEIRAVKALVAQMDQLPSISADPNIITKIVKLKYAKAKDVQTLITKWYPQIQLVVDERLNGFIVKDNRTNIDKLEKFIATVDAPKRQVQLDVKIVDLTESGAKTLGVTWNNNSSIVSTTFTEVAYNGVAWQDVNNANWPPTKPPLNSYQNIPFAGFGRKPLSIPMALSYLVTKGDAKILATPKVLTLSGEKAMVKVGQHYPITYTDPRAGVVQAEYIDIAIKLEVTPQITPDGYIMAEVAPEVSELATTRLGSAFPETITRSLKTNIIVKEGDTIILGGLYRRDYTSSKYKIPLLGDMPFVGEMFKNTSDTSSRDEVVIMITPKLVEVGQ